MLETCSFDGCERAKHSKGLCGSHYNQQNNGKALTSIRPFNRSQEPRTPCSFETCDRPHSTKGLCNTHYGQLLRGRPLTPIGSNYGAGTMKRTREDEHGRQSTYSNHNCRCELCTIAWNSYCAGRKSARRNKDDVLDDTFEHGLASTYQRGCGCPECKAAQSTYVTELKYFKDNPSQYSAMREAQAGACACCGKTPKTLVVDHSHGTKTVRGLLCHACNTGIGKLGDTVEGLKQAIVYLEGK